MHLPVATTRTPVGYTSEQTNPVAGLQHYYARDYQPGMTAWLSADPWIGVKSQPGTLNKYAYVLNNPTTCVDFMGNRPWDPSYNAVPDGHGSWNMYPKAGVTTSGGDTPPAFNWANPDGETPPPYVSNEPTGGTTQDGPASKSLRYEDLPYCPDEFFATFAHFDCRMDFRPETIQRKLLELGIMAIPGGGPASKLIASAIAKAEAQAAARAAEIAAKAAVGESRTYIDLTAGGSIRNVGTSATRDEFIDSLIAGGWVAKPTSNPGVMLYVKDGARFSLRDFAGSYTGWTAEYIPLGASSAVLKIRLGYTQ